MKKFLSFCVFLIACLALLGANEIFRPHTSFAGTKTLKIESGMGSRKIAEFLKNEGVIRSKWAFVTYVSLLGKASSLQPGEYLFGAESIPSITAQLLKGGPQDITVVFPEGWASREMAAELEQQGLFPAQDFFAVTGKPGVDYRDILNVKPPIDFHSLFSFLADKPLNANLEGYLFPDTYRFYKHATAEEVVKKMLENFNSKFTPQIQDDLKTSGHSLFEIITMASLIEKEVITDEDRAIVSGILWKRLEQNMPLQVDATIAYITGRRSTQISLQELQIDSPYNTYRFRGLPIGPIANPGNSAINAALHPKASPYFFYLSTPEGRTVFSSTFEEHTQAKMKYLR